MTASFVITADASAELEAKVAAMRRPDSYPDHPERVDAIETHLSWVFRTPRHAYKLKKPIRSALFDFSTIEARKRGCIEEVRLNRRLAPQVYLGVVPLTLDPHGSLRLMNGDTAADWLVQMRRLPDARALSRLIEAGTIADATLDTDQADATAFRTCAEVLARFYMNAAPIAMTAGQHCATIASDNDEAWADLLLEHYALPRELLNRARATQRELHKAMRPQLERRAVAGKLVEGHGDLRPEHLFLLDSGPVIIDCLEFNRALRTLDPIDDLGYLALECERLGLTAARTQLLDIYRRATRDDPSDALVHCYQSLRATQRAKLAVWHLDEPRYRDGGRWRDRAMHYVALAQSHATLGLTT